jgi:TRAP-type C4-dicarboxylate transport system permease small subunit
MNLEPEQAPEAEEKGPVFRLLGGISFAGAVAGGVALVAITVIVTYDVFARFLGHPTDWATEVAGYLVIAVAVLGAAETLRHNEHFAMTLVIDALRPRTRRWMSLIAWSLVLLLVAGLSWGLLELMDNSLQYGLRSYTILQAPLILPQTVLFAGFALLVLALIARIVAIVRQMRSPRE